MYIFLILPQELGVSKGYIRFKEYKAAKACVECGAGTWSESERLITSTRPGRGGHTKKSAYPVSFLKLIVGENNRNLKDHHPYPEVV